MGKDFQFCSSMESLIVRAFLPCFFRLSSPLCASDKETWLPTVERLFELQSQAINSNFVIAEAWVLDGANHGRAAILNETKLLSKPESIGTSH